MATITFHANGHRTQYASVYNTDPSLIEHTHGSGIGFYGAGFGLSVPVSQYQDSSYVTNSDGTSSGVKLNNTKFISVSGIKANGVAVIDETSGIPNWYAPLNIRFTHTEAVAVQNCKLRIFDRDSIANHASGVTTKVLEIRHPHPIEGHKIGATNAAGSGSLAHYGVTDASARFGWFEYDPGDLGVPPDHPLTPSPGMSGLNTVDGDPLPSAHIAGPGADGYINWLTKEGAAHQATRHDWYLALSASPQSIGSKTDYGLYFTLEYL